MKHFKKFILITAIISLVGCKSKTEDKTTSKLKVVTTTTMITDMVEHIGGDKIEVQGLMGSGVDPHLYKASEGDVSKLSEADVVIYNGLHLEGKLEEIFKKMQASKKDVIAVADAIDVAQFIRSENFASSYDPHIWFQIDYWIACTRFTATKLSKIDKVNAETYSANAETYIKELKALKGENEKLIVSLPKEKRILITAHDAFNYFGKAYDFEVVGLQGLSTATEAGVKDVQNLANLIIEKGVKAIFVETSVPKRTIEALQAAVKAKDHEVAIGGELFSDALGTKNTPEATYVGMYKHNISTIVNALK